MAKITLEQAAAWCGGQVDPKYRNVTFFGAGNDSRSIQPGQLFVALKGVRDGHDFIPMALRNGAAAVLCTHSDGSFPAIVVEDTRLALGAIARGERQRLGVKTVGVTGSVGKSTTKEMIACVLSGGYRVFKTPANHNNDIGMPMAVLGMEEDAQVAVLEMGMNHFREIAYLTDIAKPDVSVIINIGTMHIEHLGTREGILQAKMEIAEGMKPGSSLILNGDDALLQTVKNPDLAVKFFGFENANGFVKGSALSEDEGLLTFEFTCDQGTYRVNLPLEGKHFALDAMAAVAVGLEFGLAPETICQALSGFQTMAGRQEIYEKDGYTVIQDCYNAGPESMAAALAVLGNRQGRKIAVLGDMLELGMSAAAEHYKIGRLAAEKADLVFAYGPNSERVVSGALTGGMSGDRAMAFADRNELVRELKCLAKPGDVLLFKGSHGMHMELALELFFTKEP